MRKLTEQEKSLWNAYKAGETPAIPNKIPVPVLKDPKKPITQIIDNKLDLHGIILDKAFQKVSEFIDNAYFKELNSLKIITGKSGQIFQEFPIWMNNNSKVRSCSQDNNSGSFTIKLKKIPKDD